MMIRMLVTILFVGVASQVSANDLLKIPTYDGALEWQASVDRLLAQLAKDLRALVVPAEGRVSSRFGMRHHPVLGITRHHDGIDIACQVGTPVRAVLPGVVNFVGRDGGYGLMVEVEHGATEMKTRYAHLSKASVKKGKRIGKGDLLGYSGNTGLSTGPHLHFELYQQGRIVDPERYLGIQHVPVLAGRSR